MKSLNLLEKAESSIRTRVIPHLKDFETAQIVKQQLDIAKKGVKFVLPHGGTLFDTAFKGLVGSIIRMPFPVVVLEYEMTSINKETNQAIKDYRIIIIQDFEECLQFSVIVHMPIPGSFGNWFMPPAFGQFYFNKDRTVKSIQPCNLNDKESSFEEGIAIDAIKEIILAPFGDLSQEQYSSVKENFTRKINVILSFIEVLNCSNVVIENAIQKQKQKGNKLLPSKDKYQYKILTIEPRKISNKNTIESYNEERHSPREHIRRGHIRTQHYKEGVKKIWINSTVVNANKGGKIEKDYLIA